MSKYKVGDTFNVIVESIDKNGKPKFRKINEAAEGYKADSEVKISEIKKLLDNNACLFTNKRAYQILQKLQDKLETDIKDLGKSKDTVDEDLNPYIKKDLKNQYKAFDRERDTILKKRKEYTDLYGDENPEKLNKFLDKVASIPEFKPEVNRALEREQYPYYVTQYEEYPIFEPAEGGYYYAGCYALQSEGFNTLEEAQAEAESLVKEAKEYGYDFVQQGNCFVCHSKYIGENQYICIETDDDYLSLEKGKVDYS